MLKILNIKKYAAAVFCAALFLSPSFAQEYEHEHELTPEELLELENQEAEAAEENQMLPPELQKNFIIVEPVRPHELRYRRRRPPGA